jgi:hypothetical protein
VERARNPYRPGFNQSPETLAGRSEVLEYLVDALEAAALDGYTPPPLLLVGSRGMGKTALLAEAGAQAGSQYGWPRVHIELEPNKPFAGELAEELDAVAKLIEQHGPARAMRTQAAVLQAKVAGVGGEVRFERAKDDRPSSLRRSFTTLALAAASRSSGFILTLDEAHLADHAEMVAFAKVLQEGTGKHWPVVVVMAGLPAMRSPDHSVTYFERGTWHQLGLLHPQEALAALTGPAEQAGRPMDRGAGELLAASSGGYPYALQLFGHHAWRASAGQQRIDRAAAVRAVPKAQRQLERGLYASRWEAAPPSHRRYLSAVAQLLTSGQPATSRAVADLQSRTTSDLSKIRDQLITYGTLTVESDVLRFTVPGMAEYVRDQDHGERALANPNAARYVQGPRLPDNAREAARLSRVAQPKPPTSTGGTSRDAGGPKRPARPPARRPGRGR